MNRLIIITGPTGSGKTDLSINLASRLGCDIISADSRQMFRGLRIGTAPPSPEQLSKVRHHFVATLDLERQYSAAQYEADVMALLPHLFNQNSTQVMCGGSMMYIDAVCHGIDDLPTISNSVRANVLDIYARGGLQEIRDLLKALDPKSYDSVDAHNPRRNIHALEICLQAGRPCSELLTGKKKERDFAIEKYYIDMPREELFCRINRRVDSMMQAGLMEEAQSLYHLRHLNSLNTVGYKELFDYIDGKFDLDTAISRIKKNTRVYAKKQLTWLKRDSDARPFHSDSLQA